jgi:hypothetical protein
MVLGTAYVTVTVTAHQLTYCTLAYSLIDTTTNAALVDARLTISSSTGDISLNKELRGGPFVVLSRYTYGGNSFDSMQFTFTVSCPTLTENPVTTFVYNYPLTSSAAT